MRWTDEGAHCLAQVRVAVLSREFSFRRILALKIADWRYGKCIGPTLGYPEFPTSAAPGAWLLAESGSNLFKVDQPVNKANKSSIVVDQRDEGCRAAK